MASMTLTESQSKTIQTVVLSQANQLAVNTLEKPTCPIDGGIIKLLACGLCGSDVEKIKAGKTDAILGHELVGEIIELGNKLPKSLQHYKIGQRLALAHHIPCQTCQYCNSGHPSMCVQFKSTNIYPGGFSDYIALSKLHLEHTCFILKDTTPTSEAVLIEPLSCCIRAADRLAHQMIRAQGKKSVLVIGLGFIGLLSAFALQKRGFEVHGLDINTNRVEFAKQLNWVQDAKTELDNTHHFDAVFITACLESTLITAQTYVKNGGTILLFSGGTFKPVLDHNEIYHRELTVMSSYSPSLLSLQEANDWVQNKLIPLERLSSQFKYYSLANTQDGLNDYLTGKTLKAIITP